MPMGDSAHHGAGSGYGPKTGNPILSGHFPTVITYMSLNQVPTPTGTGNDTWLWLVNHLDAAHGDYIGGNGTPIDVLQNSPNFYYVKYELILSQLTTDPEVTNMATFCGANSENAFLHYYDDTTVDLSACGGSASTLIPGWTGGTATSESQARVQTCPASGGIRYVWNHADNTCLIPWMKHRSEQDVTTILTGSSHYRGMFWDEGSNESGCTPSSTCLYELAPTPATGGHILELAHENRATLATDGSYETSINTMFTAVQGDLQTYTNGDGWSYLNIANNNTTSTQTQAENSGGALTETWDTEGTNQSSSLGTQYLWQEAEAVLGTAGKVFIWVEGDYNTPTDHNYIACNEASANSRHRMWSIANYLMVKDSNRRAWYSQRPQNAALSSFWYPAVEYDIGAPSGARTLLQSGTDSNGETYAIFQRNYTKGIIIVVTHNGYGTGVFNYGLSVGTSISLGGTYYVLNSDGTKGAAVTSIQPCQFEGIVLVNH